jgi:hypothetical protein
MGSTIEMPLSCSIEVSGWDIQEVFFVERARTEGTAGEAKRVLLHHALRSGAVVFLRLVHPIDLGPAFPVAYQVEDVRRSPRAGLWELRLVQLRNRPTVRMAQEPGPETDHVLEEQIR